MVFKIGSHELVTKHVKVSDSEKEKILTKYNIKTNSLPKIYQNDSAIIHLGVKEGDVVKIERISKTAGPVAYYREVISNE